MKNPIVTLLTDFGTKDHYVASMKGVILSINPKCKIVDITHQIHPQDILGGAFVLANAFSYFPEGTIHLAVVDPEVGSARHPILLVTDHHFFVGPDNGVFSFVLRKERMKEAYLLTQKRFFLSEISPTFHGRDLFAPVAGHLTLGVSPKAFGKRVDSLKNLTHTDPKMRGGELVGEVIHIDSFGNLITNIDRETFSKFIQRGSFLIRAGRKTIQTVTRGYWEGKKGEPFALFGSSGYLEIAVKEGSAEKKLKMKRGDQVILSVKSRQ
jgi:S-adenosylmethionine hydrolase